MVTIREHNERYLEAMNYIMATRGLTLQAYADSLEVARPLLSNIKSGKQNASIDLLVKTVLVYPEINADYIIANRGSMFIQDQTTDDEQDSMIQRLEKELTAAQDEIERLKEDNDILRSAFVRLRKG